MIAEMVNIKKETKVRHDFVRPFEHDKSLRNNGALKPLSESERR